MDRIALRGVRAFGRHGANPGERDTEQAFDLDIAVACDLRAAGASDELIDTIDYATLHRRVVSIVRERSYALLERLAEEIAVEMLRDERVVDVEVSVGKPRLLDGATAVVTIRRAR